MTECKSDTVLIENKEFSLVNINIDLKLPLITKLTTLMNLEDLCCHWTKEPNC